MNELVSVNPADLSENGRIVVSSPQEISSKVDAARKAFPDWSALSVGERVVILHKVLDAFKKSVKKLEYLIISEMGKTYKDCQDDFDWDFTYFADFLNDGPKYIEEEVTVSEGKIIHKIIYEPRGVVACIVPWNFPFANFIWGVIPNLVVGNTVVFKHSEVCPLFSKLIENIMNSVPELPKGVFCTVYGDAEEGEILARETVDLIWFTGGTETAQKITRIAAENQVKVVLEAGGSNPALIFEDVDLSKVISNICKNRFTNCGQVCDAVKRLLVHESIFDSVIEHLVDHVSLFKIGDPRSPETDIGPLATQTQLDKLVAQVENSVSRGAVIKLGGGKVNNLHGVYYQPTLLTNISFDMPVWKEEVFGPVLPILPFRTEQEAIQFANNTIYGLGAVVYSNDIERARRVAAALDVGFVDINQGNHWRACNPFGGHKASGQGYEHGRAGFHELCQIKVIAEG